MSNTDIRAAVVRVSSRKIAECNEAGLSVQSGDQPGYGAEGIIGWTQGIASSKVTLKCLMPVAGMGKDLTKALLQKSRSDVTYLAAGIEYTLKKAACTQFDIESESKSGMLMGTFVFESGKPDAV